MTSLERQREHALEQKAGAERQEKVEEGAEQLFNMLIEHRLYVISRLMTELFEPEMDGKTARLRGLGGATGVVTMERLDQLGQAILFEGLLTPPAGGGADEQEQTLA